MFDNVQVQNLGSCTVFRGVVSDVTYRYMRHLWAVNIRP